MIANPSGASGTGTSQRWMRNCSPVIHSNTTRPPATGGAPGTVARIVPSPMNRARRLRASSMATIPLPNRRSLVFVASDCYDGELCADGQSTSPRLWHGRGQELLEHREEPLRPRPQREVVSHREHGQVGVRELAEQFNRALRRDDAGLSE